MNSFQNDDQKGTDFMKMVHINKQVIKIQSNMRRVLTLKKMAKDVDIEKKRLQSKKRATNSSNEEMAL